MNTTMRGVTHLLLDPPGRVCDDAQKWGHHVSLSSPSIPQYRAEYYRIHHPADIPEEDRLHPHTLNIGVRVGVEEGRSYGGEGPGIQVERLGGCHASQFRGDQSPRLVRSLGVPGR